MKNAQHITEKLGWGIFLYGLASLFWLLFRTGTKPSRIAYPCQKAAASQSLIIVAVAPHFLKETIRFYKNGLRWRGILRPALYVALVATLTLVISIAYDAVLAMKNRTMLENVKTSLAAAAPVTVKKANPAIASIPSPHRVVIVHDDNAAWWRGQSDDYWNMIDQDTVDKMVYRGLKALTGTSSVSTAWRALIPDYQPHQKIAIKINNNNVGGKTNCGPDVYNRLDSNSDDSNALVEPLNAIAKSLLEAFGSDISPEDIWVYESYRCFYTGTFVDRAEPGIQFFSACEDPSAPAEINYTGFSGTAPNSTITFRYDPSLTLPLNDVIVNADYLINIPIVRKHGAITADGSATLGFKNHYGSIQPDEGASFGNEFHDARYSRTNNNLVDINNNVHIRNKTVLVLGDAIIGSRGFNYLPPVLWNNKFSTEGTPEMLFFAVDPVAVDSVMADLLLWETGAEDTACTRNYMLEAMDLGLGVAEVGSWTGSAYPNVDITYNNIDLIHLIGADETISLFTSIPDINGNSVSELAALKQEPSEGTSEVIVKDCLTGGALNNISFDPDYHSVAISSVPDTNGNGASELAILGVRDDGVVLAQVKDSLTDSSIANVLFDEDYPPITMQVLSDIDGGGISELAVLGQHSNGDVLVQIRNASTGTLVNNVWFIGDYSPETMRIAPDISSNGVPEVIVLGEHSNGAIFAQIRDASTGSVVKTIYLYRDYAPIDMAVVPDINSNGVSELAVLGVLDNGVAFVQVKDMSTGGLLKAFKLYPNTDPKALEFLPDINNNGVPELCILSSHPATGIVLTELKDAGTGSAINYVIFSKNYAPQALEIVGDFNGNGASEIAILGIHQTGIVFSPIKDSATDALLGALIY